MSLRRMALTLLLAACIALPLASCGRKGKLEAPPGSNPAQSDIPLPRVR